MPKLSLTRYQPSLRVYQNCAMLCACRTCLQARHITRQDSVDVECAALAHHVAFWGANGWQSSLVQGCLLRCAGSVSLPHYASHPTLAVPACSWTVSVTLRCTNVRSSVENRGRGGAVVTTPRRPVFTNDDPD
eukprot:363369-Chlamydomonas_euryale.AAC.8